MNKFTPKKTLETPFFVGIGHGGMSMSEDNTNAYKTNKKAKT